MTAPFCTVMIRPTFSKSTPVLSLLLLAAAWPARTPAQTREPAATGHVQTRPPQAAGLPGRSPEDPQTAALQQSVAASIQKVVDRIQDEELQLYKKFSYFQKPERLDPNSYASVGEVQEWQKLLQQLHDKGSLVAGLYANAGKNLDAELTNSKLNAQIIQRVKQMVLDGFPWDIIQKKNQLLQQYVDAHGKLLAFYERNWGAWDPGQPLKFKTADLSSVYRKIKDQIVSAGKQLDQQYKAMAE